MLRGKVIITRNLWTNGSSTMYHKVVCVHEKNDFERSKILLNTDQEIILLDYQNNFVGILKIINNAAKNFDILAN